MVAPPSAPWSERFAKEVVFTRHAVLRMSERGVSLELALHVIENGIAKWKDEARLWLYEPGGPELGLVCVVAVLEQVVVVKTILIHFLPEESP